MQKQAVLLLNLGSPDSTEVDDVRRYLKEFLLDERVIDAPTPVRNLVVRGFILPFRPRQSAAAYRKVWTDEGSPLLVISRSQQTKLAAALDIPVFLAMRYGNPSITDEVKAIGREGITDLFIAPLYPHYAMSSYETVVVRVTGELAQQAPNIRVRLLQPFYQDEDYIEALYQASSEYLARDFDHVLFSFHGIPERHLRKTDPSHAHCLSTPDCCECPHPAHATCYRHQCLRTAHAFAARAKLNPSGYTVSFQSRLGRDPWLTPYTDHVLEELPQKGIKRLAVMCPAFVADCLETLEEIAMEGKESFIAAGGTEFQHIPCLNDHPAWIGFLRNRVRAWQQQYGPRQEA